MIQEDVEELKKKVNLIEKRQLAIKTVIDVLFTNKDYDFFEIEYNDLKKLFKEKIKNV